MITFKEEKEALKALAAEIRRKRLTRKQCPNGYVFGLSYDQQDYRYRHVALCLARGRLLEQIEPKNHPGNAPSKALIGHHYYRLTGVLHPDFLCICKVCREVPDEQALRACAG